METTTEFFDGIIHTARKRHDCEGNGAPRHRHAAGCPETIAPGERYFEYRGETPAYQSGSRHTLACARAFYSET